MRAFYEARIEHLTIHDRVRVECLGRMPDGSWCNRVSLIAVQGLLKPPKLLISDLKRYLKCDNCGERGHVDLSIVWAEAKPP
jgi:hypothetical protein